MKIIRNILSSTKYVYPVVTMGNFDGVHVGHQKIISTVVQQAQKQNGTSVVCTYSPNTKVFFGKITQSDLLQTEQEKIASLEKLGVEVCVVFQFTTDFSKMTAEEFVRDILIEKIGMKELVIGYDTNFGSDKKGDKEHLVKLSEKYGFVVREVEKELDETGNTISSSTMRKV